MSEFRENAQNLLPRRNTTDRAVAKPADGSGYFADDSMMRMVGSEALVLLGAGRAVLLQIAHPLIAAGVSQYSSFQKDPLERLMRTMTFMHSLVFGDRAQAQAALDRFNRIHDRISGSLEWKAGSHQPGSRYSGQDEQLKLWVFATLIDSSRRAYQTFIRDMSAKEVSDYYKDALMLGELMGIPRTIMPEHDTDFNEYMQGMLSGDKLAVSNESRQMAHRVLHPVVGIKLNLSSRLLRLATAGMLPPRFRNAFGLSWTKANKAGFHTLKMITRILRPMTPPWIWTGPLQPRGVLARYLLNE